MKVLLISPNKEQLPDPVFPLGLAYVASSLKKRDHDVRALDLCFSEDIAAGIKNSINDFKPDIIGISIRNIDDVAYPKKHSYITEYKTVVALLRGLTDAPIVLGGSGFTIMPEHFMKELNADYGIVGEGEDAFPKLLRAIGKTPNFPFPPTRLFSSRLNSLGPITPERGLFDMDEYYRYGGMLNIQTKRGCSFKCIYCTYPRIEGKRMRLREPQRVADEIEDIVSKTGIRHFFIVDSIFNHPAEHAAAVCSEIIKRSLNINWSCYCSPAGMTPELVELMLKAGCTGVEFGVDSLDDHVLKILGKAFSFEKVKKVSGLCRESGLKFCHFIFIGAPGDTVEIVRESISKLNDLNPNAAVIMAGIRIFPDTKLAELAERDLKIRAVGLEPVFYIAPEISKGIGYFVEEISKRKNWAMPGFEINIYERLQRKLRKAGMKGSLWEGLSER